MNEESKILNYLQINKNLYMNGGYKTVAILIVKELVVHVAQQDGEYKSITNLNWKQPFIHENENEEFKFNYLKQHVKVQERKRKIALI